MSAQEAYPNFCPVTPDTIVGGSDTGVEADTETPVRLTRRGRYVLGVGAIAAGLGLGMISASPTFENVTNGIITTFDGKENCDPTTTPIEQRTGESDWDMAVRVTGERSDKGLLQIKAANPGFIPGEPHPGTLYVPKCD